MDTFFLIKIWFLAKLISIDFLIIFSLEMFISDATLFTITLIVGARDISEIIFKQKYYSDLVYLAFLLRKHIGLSPYSATAKPASAFALLLLVTDQCRKKQLKRLLRSSVAGLTTGRRRLHSTSLIQRARFELAQEQTGYLPTILCSFGQFS